MKNFKKLVSIMLALVMATAMALIPAFAAEGDSAAPAPTHTYEVYQIFTGTVVTENGKDVLTNAAYGKNINVDAIKALADDENTGVKAADVADVAVGKPVAKNVMDYFENLKDITSEADLAVELFKFVNADSTPVASEQVTGTGEVTIEDDDIVPGYYLIKDEDGSQDGEDGSYTLYVVEVVNTEKAITFNPKVGVPEPDKKIVEDGNEVENNSAAIGDVVKYRVNGSMPTNIDKYNKYYYQFADTLSVGLTYNNDMKVLVDGEELTEGYEVKVDADENGNTIITVTFDDVKTAINDVNKDTVITLEYSATLNAQAEEKNDNGVKIVYSNNPNENGDGYKEVTGETPKDTVSTYTTELTINKVDDNGNALEGAEFTLEGTALTKVVVRTAEVFEEDANGTYYKLNDGTYTEEEPTEATAEQYASTDTKYTKTEKTELVGKDEENTVVKGMVGADGKITFFGLKAGDYTLKETITPAGYNTIKEIKFTVGFENGVFTVNSTKDNTDGVDAQITTDGKVLLTDIMNKKGSLLPSTGGIGTTIFYVVGTVLVAGAVVLLVVKSKKRAKAN